ncbi:MAG: T9SS C-terminal target domain-containing protein [Cryomorphaceae bacterium]|nr:MAG: T9SS C-terminal target domain-containing protein [Cryomorphaceae bacterium]
MTRITLLLSTVLIFSANIGSSQNYVTIPDANFVNWLNTVHPACMNGNQMDIDCPGIQTATMVNVAGYSISNLSGIEHFTSLVVLNCSMNQLTFLPSLPESLTNLNCASNQLTSLPDLPEGLLVLNCFGNQSVTTLPNIPPGLQSLTTSGTSINLNNYVPLPESLTTLKITHGNYSVLPALPPNLEALECSYNPIGELPELPSTITSLICIGNQLTSLPDPLPPALEFLNCLDNSITAVPELPETMTQIQCQNNQIESFVNFADGMDYIIAHNNQLSELPDLPSSLTILECYNNQLTSLPELPSLLNNLHCQNNQLTSLPVIPQSMLVLNCSNNQIGCFPVFPSTLASPNILDNPFICLPNYIPSMGVFGLLEYPLCEDSDLVNNPLGCTSAAGVSGFAFKDSNTDCEMINDESGMHNVSIRLLDAQTDFMSSTTTGGNGVYFLSAEDGAFTVQVDTLNKPFQVSCEDPGAEHEVELDSSNSLIQNLDFGLICKPGFDVGVQGILPLGWVFPGQEHELRIQAGDFSQWFGLNCAQGVSGEVTVSVSGPVSYAGTPPSAMTPELTGDNQFTYFLADFSEVSFNQSFRLLFTTDTTAQADDLICVTVSVLPEEGDYNPTNNTMQFCYPVVNSYDPNMKTAWPGDVEPGFDGYFNYTVYFQNTGNAPAFNIRIADTLDNQLDLSTFEVINYSHDMLTYLHGNVATFRFNNIMLPDSTTDFEGSIGYVQYRIKPLADLPAGTVIENTAHIYFDFNEAIITNTTENEFVVPTMVFERGRGPAMQIFPNPGTGNYTLELKGNNELMWVEVYNLSGERLYAQSTADNRIELNLTAFPAGMYIVRAQNTSGAGHLKVVKQ